jgi:hypothetical protein
MLRNPAQCSLPEKDALDTVWKWEDSSPRRFSTAGFLMHIELDPSLEVRLGAAAARASVSVPQLVERVLSDFLDEVADDPA